MKRNPSPVTDQQFPLLNTYWNDRAERARIDAETEHQRRLTHALLDDGMAKLNERQRALWENENV